MPRLPEPVCRAGTPSTAWARWLGLCAGERRAPTPRLPPALSEAGQARGGCMSKIRSSLPAKALTCAMLPCTLPAQTAVAAAHR